MNESMDNTADENYRTCLDLRRAAAEVIAASHAAFLSLLDAVEAGDASLSDELTRAAAMHSEKRIEIVDAYMKHLKEHVEDDTAPAA